MVVKSFTPGQSVSLQAKLTDGTRPAHSRSAGNSGHIPACPQASAGFRTRLAAFSCFSEPDAASATRMAEKIAFLLAASFSVISICCSLMSSICSLTGAPFLVKKRTASPSFMLTCFSFSIVNIMLRRIPVFSYGRCRLYRYQLKVVPVKRSLWVRLFNLKYMHHPAGSRTVCTVQLRNGDLF